MRDEILIRAVEIYVMSDQNDTNLRLITHYTYRYCQILPYL